MIRSVQAVVQVVGNHHVPVTPADGNGLRQWYYQVCLNLRSCFAVLIRSAELAGGRSVGPQYILRPED